MTRAADTHPDDPDVHARLHLRIHGRVQGVFYRATTQRRARAIGVDGWVRNRADGTVEVVAEGREAACRRLLDFCREGPPGARVEEIEVEWGAPAGKLSGFSIRP